MKLKFFRKSCGPNIIEKYCELRQVDSVRYSAEEDQPMVGEKSINYTCEVIIKCISYSLKLKLPNYHY